MLSTAESRSTADAAELDIWLAVQLEPDSGRWNVPMNLEVRGPLDAGALRAALDDVVRHHPALRSRFVSEGGELWRIVSDDAPVPFLHESAAVPYDRERALAWATEAGSRPFDLTTAPLLRANVLQHPDAALVVVCIHHLVADFWTMNVLVDHLFEAYRARANGRAPELSLGVAAGCGDDDVADADADTAYWNALLDGPWQRLAPLPDFVRASKTPGTAAYTERSLSAEPLAQVRALVARERISPAVLLLSCWSLLLHAWSGEDDGVLGMTFCGRNAAASHERIGLFTRILPVRSVIGHDTPFAEFAAGLRDQVLDSLEHSAVPLDRLRPLQLAYNTVFQHLRGGDPVWALGDATARFVRNDIAVAKHDVACAAIETADELRLRVDYDTGVYAHATGTLLVEQFRDLVVAAVAAPHSSCRALLSSLADRPEPVAATPADTVLLPERVIAQARRRPGAVALHHGGATVTYGELVARAAQLAHRLRAEGVERNDVVALLLPRAADTIVAMLAVAFSGAAYLPLDPDYPDDQLHRVLADARPRLTLVHAENADRVPAEHRALALAGAFAQAQSYSPEPPDVRIEPSSVLNVLYTSGSTGRPKGVVLPHAGIARLMHHAEFLDIGESDVFSHLSPLNFDGATYEIWGALAHGAQLVVLEKDLVLSPRDLRTELRAHGVTVLLVTTPLLNRIIEDAPDLLQSLRTVYFGGELVSVAHVRRALRWCRRGTLKHSYGPTENSFTSTWWPIHDVAETARTIPIGHPVPGTQAYVVFERSLDRAPRGAVGELLLGGDGVAAGYLGDAELTAQRFVPDPFGGRPHAKLYRTGDRVRRLPDGTLEFVGRSDNQVKIRSQRVELGEVEAALLALDVVEAAFATTWTNHRGEKELIAYVVLAAQAGANEIRARLRQTLPSFAVPSHVVVMDRLPLTANGKIDRKRLPEPAADRDAIEPVPDAGPRGGVLQAVAAAWCDTLGVSRIDPEENFFDAGGHSLMLVKLQEALRVRTGTAPSIADLLRATTVRAQAALLDRAPASQARVAVRARPAADEAIAVIGMACRFAESPDVTAFWDNLVRGRDCLPPGHAGTVTDLGDGRRRIARWGKIAHDAAFDGAFFGFGPDEAQRVDPQHGALYECLWGAVENAGLRIADIHDRTSLYAGRARWSALRNGDGPKGMIRADDAVGTDATFLATRFSYWFDLYGESLMLDTACSTSLVAVHLAAESLRHGACDYALAGGASIGNPPDGSYTYVPGHLYSDDGFCRPFDRRASGTVGADGAAAVLLRRLSDAVRDGDPVYAVIRGSAINNDGRARIGYSAPGTDGQARVIRQAVAAAGMTGADVGYVETHGTGTRLGDTIEATALTAALGPDGPPVAVGSVKASIGHTNTAAGVAGLIKAVLAVQNGYLPATPNVGEPIEELTATSDRFHILPEGRAWPRHTRSRVAGVSSFGVGGTNAHVVVEQFVPAGEEVPA